jgi:hypothetical protein
MNVQLTIFDLRPRVVRFILPSSNPDDLNRKTELKEGIRRERLQITVDRQKPLFSFVRHFLLPAHRLSSSSEHPRDRPQDATQERNASQSIGNSPTPVHLRFSNRTGDFLATMGTFPHDEPVVASVCTMRMFNPMMSFAAKAKGRQRPEMMVATHVVNLSFDWHLLLR